MGKEEVTWLIKGGARIEIQASDTPVTPPPQGQYNDEQC